MENTNKKYSLRVKLYDIMIKKYLYITLFFIGIIFQLSILLSITIYYYSTRNDFIWFNSKILTIKNMTKVNYENYQIYNTFIDRYMFQALKFSYYDLLKNSTKDKCAEGLKQCGILDTYGNKLCLLEEYPCPINDVKIDLKIRANKYIGYEQVHYHVLDYTTNYALYYTNNSINNSIICSLLRIDNEPKFIDNHSFIFDLEAFEQKYDYKMISSNKTIDNNKYNNTNKNNDNLLNDTIEIERTEKNFMAWLNVSETKIKLMQAPGLEEYMTKQFNKIENKDKYYKNAFGNVYVKNFIGFENVEQMDKFYNTDFTVYKKIFPHNIRIGLVIFCEVLLFIFVVIYVRKLYEDETKKEESICKDYENYFIICGLSIFSLTFLYFFIIFIYSIKIQNINFSYLKDIKTDDHISNFIKEFISIYNRKVLIICSIICFIISFICYLLSFVFYIKKFKNYEELKGKENLQNDQNNEDRNESNVEDKKEENNIQKENDNENAINHIKEKDFNELHTGSVSTSRINLKKSQSQKPIENNIIEKNRNKLKKLIDFFTIKPKKK